MRGLDCGAAFEDWNVIGVGVLYPAKPGAVRGLQVRVARALPAEHIEHIGPLAKYGRTEPSSRATPRSMDALSNDLRHWYFTQGGMFLSDPSRDAYFEFQDALQEVINGAHDQAMELDEATREGLRQRASRLRTSLRAAFEGFPRM